MACKSFKQSSTKLCEAIAIITRTLCTTYIDPATIEPLVASRLIPLDKGEGAVRPIGVGEVIRRIIGKCVMKVAKGDVVEASGSLQLCTLIHYWWQKDLVSRRYNIGRPARYGPLCLKCTAADHEPGGGVQYQAVLVCR